MKILLPSVLAITLAGCGDTGPLQHAAAGTTASILAMAQPALQRESDYELAARAIPGALKTVEGFYVADSQGALLTILTEGYCQYASGFVEDEWEAARLAKKLDEVAYHNERASKMFTRCLNYALTALPSGFERDLFGTTEVAAKRIKQTGPEYRTPLMWASIALGGMINHNLTSVEMIAYIPTVKLGLERVIAMDAAHYGTIDGTRRQPCDAPCTARLALPHVALGMIYSAARLGGDPQRAADEFQTALRITASANHPEGRFLLARTLWGQRIGLLTNDRKLFHDQLVKVLETDPGIWPEQRLANEVAQRKARRYLAHEKQLF